MYAKNGFRVGFGHVGVQKTVVIVAKTGFEKMKFFGRRSVLTRFTNVANSENAFSCGFLRMERFNLALPVRQTWERGIPKMRDPSHLAQTEHTQATTDNRKQNNRGTRNDEHDDDNELKMSIHFNLVISTSSG